ncbi:hypothetical protein LX59_02463 [Azomonas agilis]|uniref:Sel1 repeat-containing protein n=2 Tax=Azomonas agilis TaxID=116849 RepID=A0A562I1G4_9GAMM|nr:hypothetical protein LX59_02463 [Azomonas agilis]
MNQSSLTVTHSMSRTWPVQVALWLLDRPKLGQRSSVKRLAGRLLKQPAQAGVVTAQSRLGRLLCCDCDSARDQRIGVQMLQQAAKAGDCSARVELGQLLVQPRHYEPGQARHWLELAAAQGSERAKTLLARMFP